MASLHTLDINREAEDNKQLKQIYKKETNYPDAEVDAGVGEEKWISPNPFLVIGPFKYTTAIVIKGNGGIVSILKGNECVKSYPDQDLVKEAIMVFLEPGFYCWIMKGSQVKFIKQPE
ncbi:uncharacterized protein CIMG_08423 [Coccidioides immitis RS]|uniref:Uncharacterized protein n=1 Tax=Coccidioides immitis (strain RS) TaxID=246410 RepID=J3K5H3_COCIM|nr:uncharacterized protein CIMG_08423 [Coccidioides immitis RS]EAS29677.3 hypothetical protein CIMG_08423 [Coccidioides immitis RS]